MSSDNEQDGSEGAWKEEKPKPSSASEQPKGERMCCNNGICVGGARPKAQLESNRRTRPPQISTKGGGTWSSRRSNKRLGSPIQQTEAEPPVKTQSPAMTDSDSSNDDNGCVYMYKGNGSTDAQPPANGLSGSCRRSSSPEMDYLEMDFDPGQSNGHESSSSPVSVVDVRTHSDDNDGNVSSDESSSNHGDGLLERLHQVEISRVPPKKSKMSDAETDPLDEDKASCSNQVYPDKYAWASLTISDTFSALPLYFMIWTETEASIRQAPIIGTLSCGSSAILNALEALGMRVEESQIREKIKTQSPLSTSSLVEFLFETSGSGSSPQSLLAVVDQITNSQVVGEFFHTHYIPKNILQEVPLWILDWIKKGAVPILCWNPQERTSDLYKEKSWAYQMVHGIGSLGVYLASPLCCLPFYSLQKIFSSPSELFVSRDDIISRWNSRCDLNRLAAVKDPRWIEANVLGQIVNVIREEETAKGEGYGGIVLPVAHKPGVLMLMTSRNPNAAELTHLRYRPNFWESPFSQNRDLGVTSTSQLQI